MDLSDNDLKNIAKIIRFMAESGRGTDYCLEEGCLPMPIHFYSPIPDIKDLEKRKVHKRLSPLSGLDMRVEEQIKLLLQMASMFSKECEWPADSTKTNDPHQFYLQNNSFSFQCASLLHYMIRYYKPKRLVEVGSGFSSRVANAALKLNQQEEASCIYEIVDPFPAESTKTLPLLSSIKVSRVEELPENYFASLSRNDILFIDSGHVVRTGGDVNFLILDVLPILQPGVIIHFHDIHLPTEYPEVYFTNPAFRMFWTEAYLLQAFLAFNKEFEILAANGYLTTYYRDYFPKIYPNDSGGGSGSFWMKRAG